MLAWSLVENIVLTPAFEILFAALYILARNSRASALAFSQGCGDLNERDWALPGGKMLLCKGGVENEVAATYWRTRAAASIKEGKLSWLRKHSL